MCLTSTNISESSASGETPIVESTWRARATNSISSTSTPESLATKTLMSPTLALRDRMRPGGFVGFIPALVRIHDVAHQPVAHHITARQDREVDVFDTIEDLADDAEATSRAAGQID